MKNTILFITMLLLLNINTFSHEKVETLYLNKLDYSNINQLRINFKHKGRNVITQNAIELNEILKLEENEFAIIYSDDGKSSVYSYYDLADLNNHNPLLLIESKNISSLGDTLVIGEDELLQLESNTLLETELNSILDVQYQLNVEKLSQNEINYYFKPSSIIYPFDNSTLRWKINITSINIYKTE